VESAKSLFYEQGVFPTTLAEVAERAEVPLGNVYCYFKTKEQIDAQTDLPAGEEEPGRDDANKRIGCFLRRVAAGDKGENVRKIVNGAYAQANAAKHRHLATRADAGIAANATLLTVSTLRLLANEDEPRPRAAQDRPLPF
jgi:AcrR family transcriptional regulator